jgi:uncharacterized ferritin-like protein (DUF455 family)
LPRTPEARGLDASPAVKAKLLAAGDTRRGDHRPHPGRRDRSHVAIGNRWYRRLCRQRGLDPVATYAELATRHDAPRPRGTFNAASPPPRRQLGRGALTGSAGCAVGASAGTDVFAVRILRPRPPGPAPLR